MSPAGFRSLSFSTWTQRRRRIRFDSPSHLYFYDNNNNNNRCYTKDRRTSSSSTTISWESHEIMTYSSDFTSRWWSQSRIRPFTTATSPMFLSAAKKVWNVGDLVNITLGSSLSLSSEVMGVIQEVNRNGWYTIQLDSDDMDATKSSTSSVLFSFC